jgi:hypothetical protein
MLHLISQVVCYTAAGAPEASVPHSAPVATTSEPPATTSLAASAAARSKVATTAQLPVGPRFNPFLEREFEALATQGMRIQKTFKGHTLGVAHVALHPSKPVVVRLSAADKYTYSG